MADLSDSANWFEVDGSNNRPPPNGWPEGMMPSGVNDTARADKGALKRFWDKLNPVQNITAAGGVYTFVTSNTAYPTAYVAGELYSFKALTTSTGGDQFQVNALGPRAIVKWRNSAWVPIVAGDIEGATAPQLIYDAAINAGVGGFILLNPHLPVVNDGAGGTSLDGSLTVGGDIHAGGNAYLGGDYLLFNGNTTNSQGPYIALDGTNAILRFGPGNGAFYFENNAGTPLVTINNAGDLGQYGPYIYLSNSSGVISGVGGPLIYGDSNFLIVKPGGGNQGFIVQDYNGNNRFEVAGDGRLLNNGQYFAFCGGGYNQFYDAAGNASVFLGSGTNFYRNTNHLFQTIGGGGQMTIDASGTNIYSALEVHGTLYADQSVYVGGLQLFNAGGWLQAANIRASSQLYTDGNATVIGNINCATMSCGNYGTVNAGAINASGDIHTSGNLRADGSLFVGGVQVFNNGGWLYSPSSMQSAGTIQANAGGGSAIYAPNGGIWGTAVYSTNDIQAQGVFRKSPLGGGPKGARVECWSGAWDAMSFAMSGGSLNVSSDLGTSGYYFIPTGSFSDARLKTDIRDTKVDALAAICAIPVRRFKWNAEGKKLMPGAGPVACGLVAQELEETVPTAIGTVPLADNMRHILDRHLTPYFVRAFQQLAARVAQLEDK